MNKPRTTINLKPKEKLTMMKLRAMITTLTIMLVIPVATFSTRAARPQLNPLNSQACQLRSTLPAVFFECASCCNDSESFYVNCLQSSGKGACWCAAMAYSLCLDGGCGPCQCCADWQSFRTALDCPPIITRK